MESYRNEIARAINIMYPGLETLFTTPPSPDTGHIALPCFSFAKALRKSPSAIAQELKERLNELYFLEKTEASGGYLNFFIRKQTLFNDIITEIMNKKDFYGSSFSGKGRKALIEHTSINPNASPHVGRARNAMIGDTIVRLLRFEGFETEVHYFVNDIGKQIAMLLLGAMGKKEVSFKDLLDIYVSINERLEKEPELEKEVFLLLNRLESGEASIKEAFRSLVDICIEGQTAILGKLGIRYDYFDFESEYIFSKNTDRVLEDLKKTGKLQEDEEGRLVLNQEEYRLPMKSPYLVLTRNDGTSLYPLRDIAYTIDKVKTGSDLNIIILGEDQKLYFRQICSVLDLLGFKSPSAVHYSFILLTDGKMATRKGNVVLLEDFMREAVAKAYQEMEKRHGTADMATAEAIGYGAVKYAILRASNDKSVVFDWETALSFEGDSGPYLQYSLARINSILRAYGKDLPREIDFSLLGNNHETALVLELSAFESSVKNAIREYSPHIIANYVYGLAKKFSVFYHYNSVLNTDNEALTTARLALVSAVKQVLLNCFYLLGIEPVNQM